MHAAESARFPGYHGVMRTTPCLDRVLFAAVISLCAGFMLPVAHAEITTRTVAYEHDGAELEGFLAVPVRADRALRPAVLVVHEWWGLNDFARDKARELAELGYVALAVDMYGNGVLADTPEAASQLAGPMYADGHARMRARVRAGFDALVRQPEVDPERIGAIGFCFGGTAVLQLAFTGAPVKGVVSFHGSLPALLEGDAERIGASILVLHGADDPMVPPAMVQAFETGMKRTDADWQLVSYGGAVHSFTNPDVDRRGIPGARYHARTHRRAWEAMRAFFGEVLEHED